MSDKLNTVEETPRRLRLDLNEPAEIAIYEAMQAVEKMPPDVRLTLAGIKLQEARNLVADFIDGITVPTQKEVQKQEIQFLLKYKLSRRADEGLGQMALVTASTLEEATEKLKSNVSYEYRDAIDCRMIYPENIRCLNIH